MLGGKRYCGDCGADMLGGDLVPTASRPSPAVVRPKRRRWPWLLVLAVGAAGGGTAAALMVVRRDEPRFVRITGSLAVQLDASSLDIGHRAGLFASGTRIVGKPCNGASVSEGYSDITPGADVVISDSGGKIIATGSIDGGTWASRSCVLMFATEHVPESDFYSIEIGHRAAKRYSDVEMKANAYVVDLSIGG